MPNRSVKHFGIGAILSVVTGRLVAENGIADVYSVLNWMTGESLFTHQLPRVSREAAPVILAAHPALQDACTEAEQVTPDNWRSWLETWTKRYGATLPVPVLTATNHERIDPISELAEKVPPDRIAIVSPPEEPTNAQ